MNIAILDDEIHCIESLVIHLNNLCPDSRIVFKSNQPEAALSKLGELQIDLLFLDIEMPGLNGFQFLEHFPERNFDVIFTTAYSQYAVEAFKVRAISYLLKPVDEDELKEIIEDWKSSRQNEGSNQSQIKNLIENLKREGLLNSKIAVPVSDGYEFVEVNSIIYCQSDSNYTTLFLKNSNKILVSKTLKDIEHTLSRFSFLRVHQSYLVNPAFLTKYVKKDGGYLITQNNIQIPVSTQKRKLVTDFFEAIENS